LLNASVLFPNSVKQAVFDVETRGHLPFRMMCISSQERLWICHLKWQEFCERDLNTPGMLTVRQAAEPPTAFNPGSDFLSDRISQLSRPFPAARSMVTPLDPGLTRRQELNRADPADCGTTGRQSSIHPKWIPVVVFCFDRRRVLGLLPSAL